MPFSVITLIGRDPGNMEEIVPNPPNYPKIAFSAWLRRAP